MEGWIKLHRKLLECEIWVDDEEPYDRRSAWIDLLLSCNHRDKRIIFDGHPMVVKRGQYVTSVRKLAVRWGWGNKKTLSFLRLLNELGMIEKDSDNKRTLITIVNYEVYQDNGNTDDNTKETLTDTEGEHRRPTNKNIKNDKNILPKGNRANFLPPTLEEVKAYCSERNNTVDAEKWFDFYSAKGWCIGKNKMKDWKAAVRTWERSESGGRNSNQNQNPRNTEDYTPVFDLWEMAKKGQ